MGATGAGCSLAHLAHAFSSRQLPPLLSASDRLMLPLPCQSIGAPLAPSLPHPPRPPPLARREDGLRQVARWNLHRAPTEGGSAATARAMGQHEQYRRVVSRVRVARRTAAWACSRCAVVCAAGPRGSIMSTFLLPLGLVHSSGGAGAGACALPQACDVRPTAHDSTPHQTTPHHTTTPYTIRDELIYDDS
eukprot:scaffold13869_cov122-Isochrysis_galbana.AAC.2